MYVIYHIWAIAPYLTFASPPWFQYFEFERWCPSVGRGNIFGFLELSFRLLSFAGEHFVADRSCLICVRRCSKSCPIYASCELFIVSVRYTVYLCIARMFGG